MGETSHLNGAYYGPSIPPPNSYHRPGRGSGSGCGCCGCLCSCLFNLIFKIIITILIIVGIIVLAIWLILRPNRIKFYVDDATLTRFDLNTTTNILHYNLALNVTIRNPNKHVGIYYDRIEARAFYHGQRFASVPLQKFYQGKRNTTNFDVVFNSQNMVVLKESDVAEYNKEKTSGEYEIDVKFYLRVRFKLRAFKSLLKFKPKIECELDVPTNTNSKARFERKRCGLDW